MIIFHEGMPRSGKSYAATQDHIVPALKQGRRMYVRIDGIDHAKLADLAGITEERCRELLTELTEEDVHKLDLILQAVAGIIAAIPVPSFISSGLGPLLGSIPSDVWFFAGHFRLTECFAVLGLGATFRLTRKVATLFQW